MCLKEGKISKIIFSTRKSVLTIMLNGYIFSKTKKKGGY